MSSLPTVEGDTALDTLLVAENLVESVIFNINLQLVASELTVTFGINPLIHCVDAGLFTVTVGGLELLTKTTWLK